MSDAKCSRTHLFIITTRVGYFYFSSREAFDSTMNRSKHLRFCVFCNFIFDSRRCNIRRTETLWPSG